MRSLLYLLSLLLAAPAVAQDPTWVSTEGPGFAAPTDLVVDEEGRPLLEIASGTLVLNEDGTWEPYSAERGVLAVVDADYFVTALNELIPGSGTSPPNEYRGTVTVWFREATGAQPVGASRTTAVSPEKPSSVPKATCGSASRNTPVSTAISAALPASA